MVTDDGFAVVAVAKHVKNVKARHVLVVARCASLTEPVLLDVRREQDFWLVGLAPTWKVWCMNNAVTSVRVQAAELARVQRFLHTFLM